MTIASLLSLARSASEQYGEVPIAAALVHKQTGAIIAESANRVERDADPTAHAEIVVIREACRTLSNVTLPPQGGEDQLLAGQRGVPKPASKKIRHYAQELRKNLTNAEALLWSVLKNSQLEGHRFRKQVPIGDYIVDFACLKQKLIIELDGSQHNEENEKLRDSLRDKNLETLGYRIVRYWNSEIFTNLDGVVQNIYYYLNHPPPTRLSESTPPLGGRIMPEAPLSTLKGEKASESDMTSEHRGVQYLSNYTLYVTLEPCAMCAQAIAHARIRKVVFGAYDPKSGGVEHGARVFSHPQCHHRPEVIGGVMETECAALLKAFFEARR